MSGLKATPKPADYAGGSSNENVKKAETNTPNPFGVVKLRTTGEKPADYDGKATNVAPKHQSEDKPAFAQVQLKTTGPK
jgi:hypothetical protein